MLKKVGEACSFLKVPPEKDKNVLSYRITLKALGIVMILVLKSLKYKYSFSPKILVKSKLSN